MKIWSKTLTHDDLFTCSARVNEEFPGCGVFLEHFTLHEGPRTRRFDHVHLRSRQGRYYPNTGTHGAATYEGKSAASWVEWGWFLSRVFECDPDARCGDYKGADDFHAQTGDRFRDPRSPRERQIKRALKAVA